MSRCRVWASALVVGALIAAGAAVPGYAAMPAAGPTLLTSKALLDDAVRCPREPTRKTVLLVHGTSVTAEENWSWNYVKTLPHAGFDVCTVDLPDRELSDIQASAEYVVYAIRKLAQASGRRIAVVGISQGALQPRWALRWWPDIRHLVDDYVSMAGTNHGSLFADAACVTDCLPSLWQQRVNGANFLAALNKGDETPGDVSYTSVYSLTDEIIEPSAPTPVAMIKGASNIAVQDVCPGRYVGHVQSAADAAYYGVVIDALTHVGPAEPSRVDRDFCTQAYMPYVDPAEAIRRSAEIYVYAGVVQSQHAKVATEPALRSYARGSDARDQP
jgi:triacylglycerol lipase